MGESIPHRRVFVGESTSHRRMFVGESIPHRKVFVGEHDTGGYLWVNHDTGVFVGES